MSENIKKKKTKANVGVNGRLLKPQPVLIFNLLLFTVVCLIPMILVIIVSFSSSQSIAQKGFSFFPTEWSLDAYRFVLKSGEALVKAYGVSLYEALFGTVLSMFLTTLFAYTLSRKEFFLKKFLIIFILIPMLFSGGQVSGFIINSNVYNLRNNLLILVLPGAVTVFNAVVIRTFINSNVPDSLIEAARIDGAGETYIFFKIVFPLLLPVVASLGFMSAVGYWNEWETAMLYLDDRNFRTLQLLLNGIEEEIRYYKNLVSTGQADATIIQMVQKLPTDAARMAFLMFTLGPILVIYPFFQKYFIKGMTVGAVKG